ncbi:MAG TPA: MauE/DoxX family redox-associated membrane protein [Solirubrobacteraceae bacterium]|nr:MauE/DoxX family redox-associated membrane protein [Solirubrobacteraceae bacterium]
MAEAVTPPFAVAAIVLCVAAVAKLRSPGTAADALAVLGAPAGVALVRAIALGELALGCWCIAAPSRIGAALIALAYGGFAGLGLALARRHASCGCFGAGESRATPAQAALSAALMVVAIAATISISHGLPWIVQRGAPSAAVLLIAVVAAAYATVLAYTELPAAWGAWSGG